MKPMVRMARNNIIAQNPALDIERLDVEIGDHNFGGWFHDVRRIGSLAFRSAGRNPADSGRESLAM